VYIQLAILDLDARNRDSEALSIFAVPGSHHVEVADHLPTLDEHIENAISDAEVLMLGKMKGDVVDAFGQGRAIRTSPSRKVR
jgi:hypothetical protein